MDSGIQRHSSSLVVEDLWKTQIENWNMWT
jgi:hypothetical protein